MRGNHHSASASHGVTVRHQGLARGIVEPEVRIGGRPQVERLEIVDLTLDERDGEPIPRVIAVVEIDELLAHLHGRGVLLIVVPQVPGVQIIGCTRRTEPPGKALVAAGTARRA